MAIKIKKKIDAPQEEEELTPEVPADIEVDFDTYDALHVKSYEAAAWVERNRNLVLGGIVAVVVGTLGVIFAVNYAESQKVQASAVLSEGLAAYEVLVEGSPDLAALRNDDRLTPPSRTFQTEEEKWQAVHKHAEATLAEHDSGELGRSARLTKAAAAVQLGNFDEAIALYEQAVQGARGEVLDFATIGLANALAAKGEHDRAMSTLDKLAANNAEKAPFAKYEKARLLQRAGKTDEAKSLYHEILETYPKTTFRDDIERRLAML
jgi:tetratricopeptide (TPR) repeat protein